MENTKKYLKLAIQKNGRLTEDTLDFLKAAGLYFDSYKQRLLSKCRNFPLEILYVRDDDITDYVSSGAVDLGIVGKNMLFEQKANIKELLELQYGYCNLTIAIPKESKINTVEKLANKKIATSYPNATKAYFKKKKIPVEIVEISGSVEVTPSLGIADAISDLTSTGSTLKMNDLKPLETIFESQSIFIANPESTTEKYNNSIITKLMMRFQAVLAAEQYKYIMMNAPKEILPKIQASIPGLKSPTISPLADKNWISIQTVIKEEVFWETVEKLKKLGASGIIVLPIEKLIV